MLSTLQQLAGHKTNFSILYVIDVIWNDHFRLFSSDICDIEMSEPVLTQNKWLNKYDFESKEKNIEMVFI